MEPPYAPTHEIAYCMGLIVGEGCFTGAKESPWLAVALHAADPQPLLDLRSVFSGMTNGPYTYGLRQSRRWTLRGWELVEELPYFHKWLPSSRKREQYEACKLKWAAYFEHQRRIRRRDRPRFHLEQDICPP